jgi:hypothetical protein
VGRKASTSERAAKAAAMRAQEQRRERRSKMLIYGGTGVLLAALVAAVAIPVSQEARKQAAVRAVANAPIQGVVEYQNLGREHLQTPIAYEQTPPVGGDHHPVWQNCGVYTEPVVNEHAVHSLEHGSVWISYDASVSGAEVTKLADRAEGEGYVLVSPVENQDSPIVLTAWGHQLGVDRADDERIDAFLLRYLQGPQTPEPGAVCYGGVGTPAA